MIKKMPEVVETVETTIKRFQIFLCVLVISLFMISCKTTKQASGLHPVYVTNTKKVYLLEPENFHGVYDTLQLLNGSFGGQSFSLISYTQIDAKGISLSLMNDFGADMGNVFYDGQQVIFDSAYFPKTLPGEYIICDIQNAYYDEAALQENYKNAGLRFEAESSVRRIYDGNKLIEEITIIENTITIKNYLRGYEYNLMKIEE